MEQSPSRSILRIPPELITPKTNDHRGSQKKEIKREKDAITSRNREKDRLKCFTATQTIKKGRVRQISEKQHARQVLRNEEKLKAEPAVSKDQEQMEKGHF